jgi:uridine phosphorylase
MKAAQRSFEQDSNALLFLSAAIGGPSAAICVLPFTTTK